jgi:hypothetical protein
VTLLMAKSFSTFPYTTRCDESIQVVKIAYFYLKLMGGNIPATYIRLPNHTQDNR